MDKATVRELVESASKLLNATTLREYHGDRWELSIQRQQLFIKYLATSSELLLYVPISRNLENSPKHLLESMLCFNSQSEKTGGVFVSMNQPSGAALLMLHVSLGELYAPTLRKYSLHLISKNIVWQGIVNNAQQTNHHNTMMPPLETTIRV